MNDTQFYLTIAVAPVTTIVIVLIGVLLNNQNMNNRLGEVNNRLNDFKDLLKSEIGRVETKLEGRMDRMESALLSQIAGLDARVSRIEEKLNIR